MNAKIIDKYCIFIIMVIIVNLFPSAALSQKTNKPAIILKFVNYKKCYNKTDKVILSVENISNNSLWFYIGEESIDRKYGGWIPFILDARGSNPVEDEAIRAELMKPHKLKIITINYGKLYDTRYPSKKHGFSDSLRFFLKYWKKLNSDESTQKKIVTREYISSY